MKTFLLSVAFASAAMFCGLALATQPGNNGGGNGGCGVGQQTNGCGGQGGAGGSGLGVGVGIASAAANAAAASTSTATGGNAAVVGSGNSNVRNTNANVQGQSQSSRNRNSATGGAGGNAAATGGNSGGNTQAINVGGDNGDVVYAPAQERAPVATAYAAPLTASNGTCMGSSSAGGQSAALGLSFGTTWTDTNCDIRYDAEALRAAGLVDAARARLCQKPEIAKAMDDAGMACPTKGAQRRAAAARNGSDGSDGTFATAPQVQYQDPIIRARLGLPPLK